LHYAVPGVSAVAVVVALTLAALPRMEWGVRVHGGPTDAAAHAWRIELFRVGRGTLEPAARESIRARIGGTRGARLELAGTTDADGQFWRSFRLTPTNGVALDLEITAPDAQPRSARVELAARQWSESAPRRGGHVERTQQELRLRLAPARGAFAVPFHDGLLVELRDAQGPVAGAELEVGGAGFELEGARSVLTDRHGRARVELRPLEHTVSVRVEARASDGRRVATSARLPVVPGAIHVSRQGSTLVVTSPVARPRAYLAVVGLGARYFAGPIELVPNPDGTATGSVALPRWPEHQVWAVASSAPDFDSPAAVGWPLVSRATVEPATTFDVAEKLLLDTALDARRRIAAWRAKVRNWVLAFIALCALATTVTLLHRVRASRRRLDVHLRRSGTQPAELAEQSRGAWRDALGVVLVVLGFALLAVFVLYRLG
jgi:hypothetical protein